MARRGAAAAPLRGVHVLLVCDDEERCELFAQTLKYASALVTMCVSAVDALAVMERVRANVLVVELRAAAEEGGKIPALALTGSHEDGEALLAAGFHLHVAMPLRAAELCGAVATLAREPAAWPRL